MGIICSRPWHTLVLSCAVLALCAIGLSKLSINSDTRVFFSPKNENRQALDAFEARYGAETNLFIALHTRDGHVFTQQRLEHLLRLTELAWTLPFATRVDSLTNAIRIQSDADGLTISDMVEAGDIGDPDAVRARVMDDVLLVGRLISEDGKTAAINVTVQYPMASSSATASILEAAKAMAREAGAENAGFEVWYSGRVASSNAFSSAAKADLKTLTLFSYLVIAVLIGLILRSVWAVVALFVPLMFATACALGLAGWFGLQMNAATSFAPTALIAIGVAALLHLVVSTLANLERGQDRVTAVENALRHERFPVALTLLTTTIGFLTLNWADGPPFQQLGNIVAAGSLFSLGFGLTVLPALLILLPLGNTPKPSVMEPVLSRVSEFILDKPRVLVGLAPAVFCILVLGIGHIQIDDNFVEYFSKRYEYRQHSDAIQEHLTGLEVVEFDVGGAGDNAVTDPAYFAKLEAFEAWLRDQPKVHFVASIAETFRRLNQHINAGDPEFHTIPEDREMLAQYLVFYEMSLPLGRSLNNTISIDRSRSRVTAIMRGASTHEVRDLRERAEVWLNTQPPTSISGVGTGLAVMFGYLSSLNIKSMTGGTVLALVLISFILVGAFRSVRYGAISLLPNLLPVAIAFGVWGYLVGKVGVAVSTVGAATLGIIVDDTVHMIWRYLQARRQGADSQSAVRYMFHVAGEPMLISTLVLVSGFAVIATSGFHITSAVGALCAITILFALIADWFLLAPLLVLLDSRNARQVRKIQVSRVIGAPRDEVFEMWTRPDLIGQWGGFDWPGLALDDKVAQPVSDRNAGNPFRVTSGMPAAGRFSDFVPGQRLEFLASPDGAARLKTVVRFEDDALGTKVWIEQECGDHPGDAAQLERRWQQAFDVLAGSVKAQPPRAANDAERSPAQVSLTGSSGSQSA